MIVQRMTHQYFENYPLSNFYRIFYKSFCLIWISTKIHLIQGLDGTICMCMKLKSEKPLNAISSRWRIQVQLYYLRTRTRGFRKHFAFLNSDMYLWVEAQCRASRFRKAPLNDVPEILHKWLTQCESWRGPYRKQDIKFSATSTSSNPPVINPPCYLSSQVLI